MANISLSGIKGSGLTSPKIGNITVNNRINIDKDVNINQDYIEINYSNPNAETLINPNAYIEHPMQGYLNVENPYAASVGGEDIHAEAAALGVSIVFGILDVVENIGDALLMAGGLISVAEASIFHPEEVDKIKQDISDMVSYDWTEGLYDASVDAMGIDYDSSHGAAHTMGSIAGTMAGYTALSIGTSGAGAVVNAVVGGLSAMGSSSERALQSGATFEQAEIVGLAAGGIGAATGVLSEKVKLSSKMSNSIGDIGKYALEGAGVAAVEPVANSGVEFLVYGKDKNDNFFDYYMNAGGFQGTLMAAGIGGFSSGVTAFNNYKQNSNIEKSIKLSKNQKMILGELNTEINQTPKLKLENATPTAKLPENSVPTVKLVDNQTPKLKLENATPTAKLPENSVPTVKLVDNQTPKLNLVQNQTPILRTVDKNNPVLRIIGEGDPTVKLFEKTNQLSKLSLKNKLLLHNLDRTLKKGVRSDGEVLKLLNSTFEKSISEGNENSTKMIKKIIQMKRNNPKFNYQSGDAGDCKYIPSQSTVYMSSRSIAISDGGTLIHETGHAIFDYSLNRTVPNDWADIQDNAKLHFSSNNSDLSLNSDLSSNVAHSRMDAINILQNKTNMSLTDIEDSMAAMYDDLLKDSNFINAIIGDDSYPEYIINDLKNGIYNGRDLARYKISNELSQNMDVIMHQDYNNDIGVSGVISSIFDGKTVDLNGNRLNIRYGHPANYYSQNLSRAFNETFADFTKLKILGDDNALKMLKVKLGDEFYNYMDNIFNLAIKE